MWFEKKEIHSHIILAKFWTLLRSQISKSCLFLKSGNTFLSTLQLPIPRQRPFYLFDSIFVEKSFDICKTEVYLSCFLRFSFSCWVFIWSSITILSSENLRKSIEPELPPCWYAKLQTASTIGPKLWETSNGFFEIYKWLKFGEVIAEHYKKEWCNY